ncbi:MAG TPA: response regulator [Pyrinomonadaceae bacterium]|nr:response regulator [Pyrinomonadaceae bacterium]
MTNTILIVEDDPDIAECLQYNLELAEFLTQVARTGEECLSSLREAQTHPALVLLDLHLPDIDGLEICRQLRAEPRTQSIPIIMLTAFASDADRARGFQTGVDNYITKPYSMREVVSSIQAALAQAANATDSLIRV